MDVTPTSGPAATGATRTAEAAAKSGAVAGDFETFLKLLTTQMRNQDPMKPTESTEFVAQLASFSGVEQQVRANDRLDAILAALGGGTSAGLAEWIGREVRAPAGAGFAGDPVEVAVTPEASADRAVLVVRNDFDQVIARRSVDPAAETVTWDGLDDLGSPAAHGRYRLSLESYQGETLLGSQDGLVYATVREVRLVDGAPRLVLDGGEQVALEDVAGLR
jgi:flagellar basal-body rod modification protein FlgD